MSRKLILASLSDPAVTPPEDSGRMSTQNKRLEARQIRPYQNQKTFSDKNLVFSRWVGVIYSRSRQSKKGTQRSFMGNIFQKRIFFSDQWNSVSPGCQLPAGKVVIDFTCFSWEVTFAKALPLLPWSLAGLFLLPLQGTSRTAQKTTTTHQPAFSIGKKKGKPAWKINYFNSWPSLDKICNTKMFLLH